MARYTVTSADWSAGVAVTGDTTVQCVNGDILVTVEAAPAATDGLLLSAQPGRLQAAVIRDGSTVKWRVRNSGDEAILAIEAVG